MICARINPFYASDMPMYLDHNATSSMPPEVVDAILPFLHHPPANPYYHGETLLMELDRAGFALSSGSACHSMVTEPSHVLTAMVIEDDLALNAIQVSFGMNNSLQDVDALLTKLKELINKPPAVIRQAAV